MTDEQEAWTAHLKLIEHYFDWDHQIKACSEMQELSKLEIQKFIEAIRFLRNFLGDDFPIKCMHQQYIACHYFWNIVPWTREWFTWLAHCFRELKDAVNFPDVLKKFKSNNVDDFKEAISLLESAGKFQQAGFTTSFAIGVTNAKGEGKNPDIELRNPHTSEKLYVEVTRLTEDIKLDEYGLITGRIIHGGLSQRKNLNFSGRLFKTVSDEHWAEVLIEIDQKIALAAITDSFQEIHQAKTIELAIAPINNPVLLEWSAEKGYDINAFHLPPSDTMERIKSKIIHKSKQTSAGHANILVVRQEDVSHHIILPEEYISEIEETIYKCNDLAAVIIIGYEFGGTDKDVKSHGINYFIQKTERHAWSSRAVIVFNKLYHKVPITLHTLNKLIESFI